MRGHRFGQREDRSGCTVAAQSGERNPGRPAACHDHRGQRGTGRRFERLLPTGVHLDEVEEGADDPVDAGEQLRRGASTRLVERPLERIGTSDRPGVVLFGFAKRVLGPFELFDRAAVRGLGVGHRRLEAVPLLLLLREPLCELVIVALECRGPTLGCGQPAGNLVERPPVAFERVLERSDLGAGDGDLLVGVP